MHQHRLTTRSRRGVGAWLLAATLLLVQAGALAHEFDHQLHKHDAPCALSAFANHLDHTPAAKFALPPAPFGQTVRIATAHGQLPSPAPHAPTARGPPAAIAVR